MGFEVKMEHVETQEVFDLLEKRITEGQQQMDSAEGIEAKTFYQNLLAGLRMLALDIMDLEYQRKKDAVHDLGRTEKEYLPFEPPPPAPGEIWGEEPDDMQPYRITCDNLYVGWGES